MAVCVVAVSWLVPTASARTILVPSVEAPSIQAGIAVAVAGDTVVVACGTYNEHSLIMKSGIVLRSETGQPDCVTIDAQGAGRVMVCEASSSTTAIEGLTLTGGTHTDDNPGGGGVYVFGVGHPTFRRCVITGNVSGGNGDGSGGGVELRSSAASFDSCAVVGNTAGEHGGGVFLANSTLSLRACDLTGNDAPNGAGLFSLGGSMLAQGCDFSDNVGSGIVGSGAQLIISDCTVARNRVGVNAVGGSLYMTGSECVDNWTYDTGGGCHLSNVSAQIYDCSFRSNESAGGGGGLYLFGGAAAVLRCLFEDNFGGFEEVITARGGGLYSSSTELVLEDCTFRRNMGMEGGALRLNEVGSATVRRCRFEENRSHDGGGAGVLNCSPVFQECIFYRNEATPLPEYLQFGRGGGLLSRGVGTTSIVRCDFVDDTAAQGGGVSAWTSHHSDVSHSIVTSAQGGAFATGGHGSIEAACTNSYDNAGGNWLPGMVDGLTTAGNFAADPAFCDASSGDFRLRANSMCTPGRSPCTELVGALPASCNPVGVYLATRSSGLSIFGDGLERPSDALFDWSVGTAHEVSAPAVQEPPGGVRYDFRAWSDAGARTHTIQVSSTDDVFTADYDSLFFLETVVQQGEGTVSPASGWRTPGEIVPIAAFPESGWVFAGWTGMGAGAFTGVDAETTVTMLRPIRQIAVFQPTAAVTFVTEPPGIVVRIDGVPHVAPFTVPLQHYTQHHAEVDSIQGIAPGHRARFLGWNAGEDATLTVSVGTDPLQFTATFVTEYELTFEATDQAQFQPGNLWAPERLGVTIEAVPEYGVVFQGWIGTGTGSYTGPDNPSRVTMYGPIHQRAIFGPGFAGTGYEFSISASGTDPSTNASPSTGAPRLVYLWLTCSERGLSALELGVNSTMSVLGFEPDQHVLNVGTATSLQLAIGGCPAGNPAAKLLGRWLILDTGGTFCVGPSDGAVFATVDCHPTDTQLWPDPRVTGFASDGSLPCIVGSNECFGPTALALSGLGAALGDHRVDVAWFSQGSFPLEAFRVYRHEIGGGTQRLEGDLLEENGEYLWVDATVEGDRTYEYEVGVDVDHGHEERYGPVAVTTPLWDRLVAGLRGAFPNPVTGETRVRFALETAGRARVSMYDVAGRLVDRLTEASFPAGEHSLTWRADAGGRRLPGGIYFLQLEAGGRTWSRKMMLVTPKRAP